MTDQLPTENTSEHPKTSVIPDAQLLPQTMDTQVSGRSLHPSDQHWIAWIKQSQKDGNSFFKIDVAFNSSTGKDLETLWLRYFHDRIAYKIKKVIGPSHNVIDVVREYEFGLRFKSRHNKDWRCPHHIHAIVGVPDHRSCQMLSDRLKRDITSLSEVSSVHIELIPVDSSDPHKSIAAAFAYMRKGKTYRPLV
jgi:hypothetical protein